MWLARLERGLSAVEARELKEWLALDRSHEAALFEVARVWDQMDSLNRLADLFPEPAPPRRTWPKLTLAFAIPALLAVAFALFVTMKPTTRDGLHAERERSISGARMTSSSSISEEPINYTQLFETAVGEHSTVRLPDGTELTLNTNSRVQADFTASRRTLRLEQGEFFVHVAHDVNRPLTVFAGSKLVRAVGTSFNVEIKDDQRVEVIVTEGKVLIGVADKKAPRTEAAWLEQFDTSAVAGEQVLLSDQKKEIQDIGTDDIDVKLAWRSGNLIFHGEPLADALGEIERYTRVTFVIKDERLKTIRVAGLFKAGDVDGLLETLRKNFNISYERVGAERIVLKSE
jgi:transmembrane sensor